MAELVRAKDPVSGAEITVDASYAEAQGLTILRDKPAVDAYGRVIPSKLPTDKAGAPAAAKKE